MKKLLLILLCLPLLFGCDNANSQSDVLINVSHEELINQGDFDYPKMYYEGKLFSGIEVTDYPNGKSVELSSDRKIYKKHVTYKNGIREGIDKQYYQNGELYSEGYWNNNKLNGLMKHWYENGQIKSEWNWKDWKLDGIQRHWYENGQIESEFTSNRQRRIKKRWHENGQIEFDVILENDNIIFSECWNNNGEKIKCEGFSFILFAD